MNTEQGAVLSHVAVFHWKIVPVMSYSLGGMAPGQGPNITYCLLGQPGYVSSSVRERVIKASFGS